VKGLEKMQELWNRVFQGQYVIKKRTRIQVSVVKNKGEKREVEEYLALNEAFIGEAEKGRSSNISISVDGKGYLKRKFTGILVCSGSGSSGWLTSALSLNVERGRKMLEHFAPGLVREKGERWLLEEVEKYNEGVT